MESTDRERSNSIFTESGSNVIVRSGGSTSHGVLVNFEGSSSIHVVCTAHGLFDKGPGNALRLRGPPILELQGSMEELTWTKVFSWKAFATSCDEKYDCAIFVVDNLEDMKPVHPTTSSCLSEKVSNIGFQSSGDFVATSRVVQEDQYRALLGPAFSLPGLSGLGMLAADQTLVGIVKGNGRASPENNIYLQKGYYNSLYLHQVVLNAKYKARMEPIFTVVIKVCKFIKLYCFLVIFCFVILRVNLF